MKKITEYELISEKFLANIPKKIRELMKEGWQPHRNIKKVGDEYLQAMVKYEDDTNNTQQLNS